jgi:large subunit ribosomal protein L30e
MEDVEIIKKIVETGEVSFGSRSVSKKGDKAKLLIVAENCPKKVRDAAEKAARPVYTYNGTSLALGELCGKPFPIAAMAVINPGQASITALLKEAKK